MSRWRLIQEFPDYAIDQQGTVVNRKLNRALLGDISGEGTRSVIIYNARTNRHYNRGVNGLVQKAFEDSDNTAEVLFRWVLIGNDWLMLPNVKEVAEYLWVTETAIRHALGRRGGRVQRRRLAWVWSPYFSDEGNIQVPVPVGLAGSTEAIVTPL